MKILIMILFLFTTKTYASGCDASDVYLSEEVPVLSLGEHSARYQCENQKCWIHTTDMTSGTYESHFLHSTEVTDVQLPTTSLPNLEVKIYRQYFVSSCTSTYRYVLGVEYEGKRYREVEDLIWL